jgi:curved DNA-binding protein CbpA
MNKSPGAEEKFKEISAAYEVSSALWYLGKIYGYAECSNSIPRHTYYIFRSNSEPFFNSMLRFVCVHFLVTSTSLIHCIMQLLVTLVPTSTLFINNIIPRKSN